ncbi:MAG TPA: thioredoxin family protein [Chloroflexota bacterium]
MDGLERTWGHRVHVVRLDVRDRANQDLLDAWHVDLVPTFLLFDAQGREVYRGASPSALGELRRKLETLAPLDERGMEARP